MKNAFYFIQKALFVLEIFKFLYLGLPLFLFPVSHCFTGWSKINLKVYGVITCLNKKFITHFVWYLENEKRYDIETLSIDRVLNKEHFYGKIMQKRYFERGLLNCLKKLTLVFFQTQFLLMNKIIKNKLCLELVTIGSSGCKTSSGKFLLLVMCYLTMFNDVKWSAVWVFLKITFANLYKPVNGIINYSTFRSLL